MPNRDHLALGVIVNKIRIIAETNYNGELDSNLYTIFTNDLTLEERRAVLFFMMTLYIIFESHITHAAEDMDRITSLMTSSERAMSDSADRINQAVKTLDEYNGRALVDLKGFATKVVIVGTMTLIALVVLILVWQGRIGELAALITPAWDTAKMMFDL